MLRSSLPSALAFTLLFTVAVHAADSDAPAPSLQDYKSPYSFAAAVNDPALTADFRESPKRPEDFREWSPTPFADWTNFERIRALRTTWGPIYRAFDAPAGAMDKPASWAQLRVLAAANQIRGQVPYAHHHMHVWNVPNEPRWIEAKMTPGVGIDCSDFTHWAYSYGMGIQLRTGIGEQAETRTAPMHLKDGKTVEIVPQRLYDVHDGYNKQYDSLVKVLQPGDLLFIRSDPALTNKISHVITWLGSYVTDANGKDQYFVMDSHGGEVIDSNGVKIPSGPQIRPFREKSYYFNSFDHVLRFFPLQKSGDENPVP
jgi:cell wall-associated NlpC family hydrolase